MISGKTLTIFLPLITLQPTVKYIVKYCHVVTVGFKAFVGLLL